MKKETTRRTFLCDAGAMCLFGAYGWWRENPPAVKKKAAICSKKLSMHGASDAEIEKIFKDTEPLLANIGLTTVVQIIHIDSYELPGYFPFQVSVDCKGLDSWGTIQNICMEFFLETIEQRDRIVEDLKADSIFLIKGEFMLEDTPVTFYEPDYNRIKPKSLENKMKKLFQIFEDSMKITI